MAEDGNASAANQTGRPQPTRAQNSSRNMDVDRLGVLALGLIGVLGIVGLLVVSLLGRTAEYPGAQESLSGVQATAPAGEQPTPPTDEQATPPAGGEPAAAGAVAANAATSSGRLGLLGQISSALAATTAAAVGGIAGVIRRGSPG